MAHSGQEEEKEKTKEEKEASACCRAGRWTRDKLSAAILARHWATFANYTFASARSGAPADSRSQEEAAREASTSRTPPEFGIELDGNVCQHVHYFTGGDPRDVCAFVSAVGELDGAKSQGQDARGTVKPPTGRGARYQGGFLLTVQP